MSRFTKNITKEFDFDGDNVTVTMKRLKRKDALKLMPYIGEPNEQGEVEMTFNDQMEMIDVGGDMLKKYIV